MHPLEILYWSCLALGGMYTAATALMGGLSHVAAHAGEIGHSFHLPSPGDPAGHVGHVGHAGHIADAGHAGHLDGGHAGNAHADGGHVAQDASGRAGGPLAARGGHLEPHAHLAEGDGGFNLLQYLNPMSVAGFLLGFGGGGVAARTLGVPLDASLLYAAAGGSGIYTGAYLIISRLFGNAQATSHNRREALVGVRAQVTAPIAGALPGMVSYTVAGSRQSLVAVTEDEESIPVGATVRIRKIEGNRAQVIRID